METSFGAFFAILLIVLLGVYLYTRLIEPLLKRSKSKKPVLNNFRQEVLYNKLPYKVKNNFLTKNERTFLFKLGEYVGAKAYICPMVGLKDIFTINTGNRGDYQKYLNKIWRKHVDFILVSPDEKMKIICGIELDDTTHNTIKAKERDAFKDRIFTDAGVPLIRFKTWEAYNKTSFDRKLNNLTEFANMTERATFQNSN